MSRWLFPLAIAALALLAVGLAQRRRRRHRVARLIRGKLQEWYRDRAVVIGDTAVVKRQNKSH